MKPSAAIPVANHSSSAAYDRAYAVCVDKARRNLARLAARPVAGPFARDGDYFAHPEGFFDIGNWTSSFHTGMALQAFESTHDPEFVQLANRLGDSYRAKVTRARMDTMHDLGFLYSLYSVALHRLTGDVEHQRTGLLAADELAKRFSARGGYIRAWGRMDENDTDYAGLAIIDCMMNLPLLFWAARETGSRFYSEIAVAHADTTQANFVRADDSVCHAFRFDLTTGAPLRPENYCGYAVDSHWARGTAWAIYGFALAFRHTGRTAYLDTAARLAKKFVALLDREIVPLWDFRLPAGSEPVRDSSAAAIVVCGLDEVCAHRPDTALSAAAEKLLGRLCSAGYLDPNPECPGVLRHAEVGAGPGVVPGTIKAQDVYTSWGDYYFMEALSRRLNRTADWW
ncbi:MAG: glycoside hydrolase family 88 protein [Verrucomicrobia bacterium]|nr:glycoside hydrolase family 88 protein [Verrucomicrobiota bacterium]